MLVELEVDYHYLAVGTPSGTGVARLLREKNGKAAAIIFFSVYESIAIQAGLESVVPSRPQTHDLMKNLLTDRFAAAISKVVITKIDEGTYYADIYIKKADGKEEKQDCRPSDGIALALRFRAPIYAENAFWVPLAADWLNQQRVREFEKLAAEDGRSKLPPQLANPDELVANFLSQCEIPDFSAVYDAGMDESMLREELGDIFATEQSREDWLANVNKLLGELTGEKGRLLKADRQKFSLNLGDEAIYLQLIYGDFEKRLIFVSPLFAPSPYIPFVADE